MYDNEIDFEKELQAEKEKAIFSDSNLKLRYGWTLLSYCVVMFGFVTLLIAFLFGGIKQVVIKNPTITQTVLDYASDSPVGLVIVDSNEFQNSNNELKDRFVIYYVKDDSNGVEYVFLINAQSNVLNDKEFLDQDNPDSLDSNIVSKILNGDITLWANNNKIKIIVAKDNVPDFIDSDVTIVKVVYRDYIFTTFGSALNSALNYLIIAIVLGAILFRVVLYDFKMFRKSKTRFSRLAIGIGTTFGIVFAFNIILSLIQGLSGYGQELSSNQLSINNILNTPSSTFLMIISIVIFGPFVEELVFRKALMGFFKNDIVAIVISTILFACIHVTTELAGGDALGALFAFLSYLSGGIAFGVVYVKNGRNITYPLIAHSFYNLLTVLLLFI